MRTYVIKRLWSNNKTNKQTLIPSASQSKRDCNHSDAGRSSRSRRRVRLSQSENLHSSDGWHKCSHCCHLGECVAPSNRLSILSVDSMHNSFFPVNGFSRELPRVGMMHIHDLKLVYKLLMSRRPLSGPISRSGHAWWLMKRDFVLMWWISKVFGVRSRIGVFGYLPEIWMASSACSLLNEVLIKFRIVQLCRCGLERQRKQQQNNNNNNNSSSSNNNNNNNKSLKYAWLLAF